VDEHDEVDDVDEVLVLMINIAASSALRISAISNVSARRAEMEPDIFAPL
jgi:hypothetical protein